MREVFILLVLFTILISPCKSQIKSYQISGIVKDQVTGEPMIGATITPENKINGTVSDVSGYFSLTLNRGNHVLFISYVGYSNISDTIQLYSDISKTYELKINPIQTKEVIITSRDLSSNIQGTSTALIELSSREIEKLPSLMGEPDLMRIIQLTPGVQSANEGNSGFYVRGGGADQNLVLFDNAVVYNPSHVLGFFSVFNNDIIRNVKFIKSGITANYGGRLSSVVEINSLDPSLTEYSIDGSIGLILSKLTFQGPVIKNKVSLLISGRRSYLDEVLKPAINAFVKEASSFYSYSKYYFYDLNSKLLINISARDRLSVTIYNGNDYYRLNQYRLNYQNNLDWGNSVIASTYNHIFNSQWYLENTLSFTKYKFNFSANQYNVNIGLNSSIEDWSEKIELNRIKSGNRIIIGAEYRHHHFVPNNLSAFVNDLELDFGPDRDLYAHEAALFFNQEYSIGNKFSVNVGLRANLYLQTGPYSQYERNFLGEVSDTVYYKSGQLVKKYNNIEPRITGKYQFSTNSSIKAAYTMHAQYIHLASANSVTLPTDVWLPSTERLKPQKSNHYTIGYYRNIKNNMYSSSVELYYKDMKNQVELLYGFINNFQDKTFEESMVFGKGRSYGIEFLIRKNEGKLNGWLGYTLSRTERQFDEINEGKVYPAKYDRRHEVNLVVAYQIGKKWTTSATFIYATGNAMTIPEYKYILEGNVITGYSGTNSFRMPAYHRLDLSVNYLLKNTNKFSSTFNISIFNVYNRANPYFIYFEITGDVYSYDLTITPRQVTLFPIIPSISWNFIF